ncbi:MAG TPA: lipocalin-like domain-containing protein [Acetobacteraceae bacterium]|nr:lipocalin-like domain-containing protein [Acetobacteraceae bacterium]
MTRRILRKGLASWRRLATWLMVAAMVAPSGAIAQQGVLARQIVGTWEIVSVDIASADGTHVQPFGPKPNGIIMLDASGRYANVFGSPDRPKIRADNRLAITAEQFGAAAKEFAANFGRWSVAETDRTITLQFEGSLDPNNEGARATYSLALAGDDMKFSITLPGQRVEVVEYRRPGR